MKRCPICNRTYEDTQTFCSEDGTRLVEDSPPPAFDPMATVMSPSIPQPPPPTPQPQSDRPQETPFNFNAPPAYQTPAAPPAPQQPALTPQPLYGSQMDAASPGGSKLVPVVIGGVAMGALTAIPIIGSGACCWFWAIGGGLLAGMLYIKRSAAPVEMGQAAIIGAMAGVIGGIINTIIGLPLAYLVFRGNMTSTFGGQNLGPMGYLVMSGILSFIALVAFGALGAIISVPLFEKRNKGASVQPPPPPPPPQQNFGGYR